MSLVKAEEDLKKKGMLDRVIHLAASAGDDHSAVKLTVDELEKIAGVTGWVDVCK